jgi:hypothetical protein
MRSFCLVKCGKGSRRNDGVSPEDAMSSRSMSYLREKYERGNERQSAEKRAFLLMNELAIRVPVLSYLLCYFCGSLVDQICGNMTDSRIELVAPLK